MFGIRLVFSYRSFSVSFCHNNIWNVLYLNKCHFGGNSNRGMAKELYYQTCPKRQSLVYTVVSLILVIWRPEVNNQSELG